MATPKLFVKTMRVVGGMFLCDDLGVAYAEIRYLSVADQNAGVGYKYYRKVNGVRTQVPVVEIRALREDAGVLLTGATAQMVDDHTGIEYKIAVHFFPFTT